MSLTTDKKVTVAIGINFLEAYSKIPQSKQKKVREFVEKFQDNPIKESIHYEPIKNTKDKNLYSVRIDQDYRAIILKPDSGSAFALLWVDHHDEAYKWAKNKICKINPEVGNLQILDVNDIESASDNSAATNKNQAIGVEKHNLAFLDPGTTVSQTKLQSQNVKKNKAKAEPIFKNIPDKDLLGFGLPKEFLKLIKNKVCCVAEINLPEFQQ